MLAKLQHALRLEFAADLWWDRLSVPARKAYVKAHPNSKYAKAINKVRLGVAKPTRSQNSGLKYGGHGVRPDHPAFIEAVKNTEGAKLHRDGMQLNVSRFQKPTQAGKESVRDGVFFLPYHSKHDRDYTDKTNSNSIGGSEKFKGTAHLKAPIIVNARTGGSAPASAYEDVFGPKALDKLQSKANTAMLSLDAPANRSKSNRVKIIKHFLTTFGGNPNKAEYIIDNSKIGNQLLFAMTENVIANQLKKKGYDSVLAYYKSYDGKHRFTELFDLRHSRYPRKGEELARYPEKDWTRWMFHEKTGVRHEPASRRGDEV